MYAIVRTGGKQYRVEEGRTITVEKLPGGEGDRLELSDVLLIAEDGEVTIGAPTIEGARVVAEVEAQGRAKKIIVFKYKSKVRTRKKTGHRQPFTRLAIQEILRPGQEPKQVEKPKRGRAKDEEEEAVAPAAEAEVTVGAPEAEIAVEAPKRRPRRKVEAEAPVAEAAAEAPAAEAPKRRRAKAEDPPSTAAEEKPKTPRRRVAKPKTEGETE